MEPGDFFRVAGRLLQHGDGPCCRSAISRAYYGLFHTAKSLLAKHGFQAIRNQDIHKITSMRLENSGNISLAVVGSQLSEMRGLRNKADYQLDDPKTEVRATAVFWNNKAKGHSDVLEKTFGGPDVANVIAAIRKWEQLTSPN